MEKHTQRYLRLRSGKEFDLDEITSAIADIKDDKCSFDNSRQRNIEQYVERYQYYINNAIRLRYDNQNPNETYRLREIYPHSGAFVIEDFLPDAECIDLIHLLERSEKKHIGFTSSLLQNPNSLKDMSGNSSKRSIDMDLNDFKCYPTMDADGVLFQHYNDKILKKLMQIAENFRSYFLLPGVASDYFVSELTLRKYTPNSCAYGYHSDYIVGDSNPRFMAFVLYLNNVVEGGETKFLHHNLKVKPLRGRLLVFPSTHLHIHTGLPPISNPKYIVTSFFHHK